MRRWAIGSTDVLRGVGGGMIVGMPLIYTMEMWFIGMYVSDWLVAGALLFAFIVNTGLNHASGFSQEHTIWSDVRDTTIAMGISSVLSLIVLVLINTLHSGLSFAAAISIVSLTTVPISIGFSIANTQFGGTSRTGSEENQGKDEGDEEKRKAKADIIDIGITVAGATVFVFAVAPTQEIEMISAQTTGWHWAGLVVFSVILTYAMVFVAEFAGSERRRGSEGLLQESVPETILAYAVSVATGILLLFLMGRLDAFSSLSGIVSNGAVIGLPAAVGGAAGRLIV